MVIPKNAADSEGVGGLSGSYGEDSVDIYVVSADLDLVGQGLSETEELSPGAFIRLNDDNDNEDRTQDRGDEGLTLNEDDLVRLNASDLFTGGYLTTSGLGEFELVIEGQSVKLWENSDRSGPVMEMSWSAGEARTWYVEGYELGESRLMLNWTSPTGNTFTADEIKVTVVKVDLDIVDPEVAEEAEADPGGMVGVGATRELNLHRVEPSLPGTVTFYFNENRIRVWKDEDMTEPVSPGVTEFDPGRDHTLYAEGIVADLESVTAIFTPDSPAYGSYTDTVALYGNLAPVGGADSYALVIDRDLTMSPLHNDSDPEDDPFQIIGVDQADYGEVTFSGDTVTYTPDEGYTGTDSFTYYIADQWRPQTKEHATPVVVSLDVTDPVTLGTTTITTIDVEETGEGTFTTHTASVELIIANDDGVASAIDERTQAEADAETAWQLGEETAAGTLEGQLDAEATTVQNAIQAEDDKLLEALVNNNITLDEQIGFTEISGSRGVAKNGYEQAEQKLTSVRQANTPAIVSDVSGDQESLETLQRELEGILRSFFAATDTIDTEGGEYIESPSPTGVTGSLQTALDTAFTTWDQQTIQAMGDFAKAVVEDSNALISDIEDAIETRDEAILSELQTYIDNFNMVIAELHSQIEQKQSTYLTTIRTRKDSLEQQLEEKIEAASDAILDSYADYYEVAADHIEETATEDDLRDATETVGRSIFENRSDVENERAAVHRAFVQAEQDAMKTMAVRIAEAQHTALGKLADHAKTLKDGVADDGKDFLDANADAVRDYDNSQVDEREDVANSLTGSELDYRLAAFNADVDKTEELVEAAKAAAAAQLAKVSEWLINDGGAAGAAAVEDVAGHGAIVDAIFEKRLDDLAVEQAFIETNTGYEKQKLEDDHADEAAFGSAVVGIAHASKGRIAGYLNQYEKEVNRLDRQWVTDASSKDVGVVEAIADTLKEKNLEDVPDGSAWETLIGLYITSISEWPTHPDSIPAVTNPEFRPHLISGAFDISEAESAFAPEAPPEPAELEVTEEAPPAAEETLDEYYVQPRIGTQPQAEDHRYGHGQSISDQAGNHVGVVHIELDENGKERVLVKAILPAGLPVSPQYPDGVGSFPFYLTIGAVEAAIAAAGADGLHETEIDDLYKQQGESPEHDAALTGSPLPQPVYDSVFDVMPHWMSEAIAGREGGPLDTFLDRTDAFGAGIASTVTGGLTDQVRSGVYGDIADVSDSGFYTAGQIVGIAPAFAVGGAAGSATHATRWYSGASRAINGVSTAYGGYSAADDIVQGEVGLETAVNLTPFATYGVGRYTQWVKCFEAGTPVAVGWSDEAILAGALLAEAAPIDAAGFIGVSDVGDSSALGRGVWLVAGCGLLYLRSRLENKRQKDLYAKNLATGRQAG